MERAFRPKLGHRGNKRGDPLPEPAVLSACTLAACRTRALLAMTGSSMPRRSVSAMAQRLRYRIKVFEVGHRVIHRRIEDAFAMLDGG